MAKLIQFLLAAPLLGLLYGCPGNGNGISGAPNADIAVASMQCTWGSDGGSLSIVRDDQTNQTYLANVTYPNGSGTTANELFSSLTQTISVTEQRYLSDKFDLRVDISAGTSGSMSGQLDATLSSGTRIIEPSLSCSLVQ